MLTYRRSDNLEIIGYVDSYFSRCIDTMKSNSGYIYMLAGGAVSWKSVKQSITTSSTMVAEFIACYEASNNGIWMRNFVTGLRVVDSIQRPLKLYCDNDSAVKFANKNKSSRKSKFVALKLLYIYRAVMVLRLYIFPFLLPSHYQRELRVITLRIVTLRNTC